MAIAAVTFSVMPAFMTGALAVQMGAELGIDISTLGLLIGLFFTASAAASPLMGRIVERTGWQLGIRTAVVGSGIIMICIALLARSPASLSGLFPLGGMAAAVAQPAANLAIARSVPNRRHGLMFGIKHAAVPIATMLGGLAVPTVALTVGWRWAFVAVSILAFATAAAVPRHVPPAIRTVRFGARSHSVPASPNRVLALLAVGGAFGIGGINALAAFIVSYAVDIGISESKAGLLLAAGSFAGIITRVASGWWVDRRSGAGLSSVALLMAVGALGMASIATGGQLALIAGGLVAFAGGWGWSGLFTLSVVTANEAAPAAATGITQTGIFVGAAAGPPLLGLVADHYSFTVAWVSAAVGLTLATIVVWFLRPHLRPQPPHRDVHNPPASPRT